MNAKIEFSKVKIYQFIFIRKKLQIYGCSKISDAHCINILCVENVAHFPWRHKTTCKIGFNISFFLFFLLLQAINVQCTSMMARIHGQTTRTISKFSIGTLYEVRQFQCNHKRCVLHSYYLCVCSLRGTCCSKSKFHHHRPRYYRNKKK